MDDYICWNKHGEEGTNDRDQAQAAGQQDGEDSLHEFNDTCGEEAPFGNQELRDDDVADIAASFDEVHLAENLEEMVRDAGFASYACPDLKKLEQLLKDMKTPLYPNCRRYTRLSGSLKLLQLKASNHLTDRGFKEMLEVLADMFPEENEIPKTTYEAKKIICPMGLKFEKIDACKNNCILFTGDNKNATECPKCQTSRYKQGTGEVVGSMMRRKVPMKVVWYFPIIPRLKRLFATSKDAQLLTWHSDGRKVDGYIRHPAWYSVAVH